MQERSELLDSLRYLLEALREIEGIGHDRQELYDTIERYGQYNINDREGIRSERNYLAIKRKAQKRATILGILPGIILGSLFSTAAKGIASLLVLVIVAALVVFLCRAYAASVAKRYVIRPSGITGEVKKSTVAQNLIFRKADFTIGKLLCGLSGDTMQPKQLPEDETLSDEATIRLMKDIDNRTREIADIRDRQIPEADAKLLVTYEKYKEIIEAFPPAYRYAYAVERTIFFIENQRADNIKEALNGYEEETFRNKTIDLQQQQLAEQQKTAYAAAISAAANLQTAYNTGQIAANTADMVVSLRNIDANTAATAANTAAIANNTAAMAADTASIAASSRKTAKYAKYIDQDLGGSIW